MSEKFSKWQKMGAGLDVTSGAAMTIWPEINELAMVAFIVGIIMMIWPFIIPYMIKPKTIGIIKDEKYIPLSEAAQKVYEAIMKYDPDHPHIIRAGTGEDIDSIIDYFSVAISLSKAGIYGKKPPSTIRQSLNKNELQNDGFLCDHGNKFECYKTKEAKYVDIAIMKNCLSDIIEELISEGAKMTDYVRRYNA